MKIPLTPPPAQEILERLASKHGGAERAIQILMTGRDPAPEGKYRHWDILRHLAPPDGLTTDEWWLAIKVARRPLYRRLSLLDRNGNPFQYAVVDPTLRLLHTIDQQAGGAIRGPDVLADPHTNDTYVIKSLIEEAITSSQLEGAATTREVAKDMLQRGRPPRDRSERMIFNNYQAMQFIRSVAGKPLTPEIVFQLHRVLTDRTLDDPSAAGRFRRPGEPIRVIDEQGRILHTPPDAAELADRLDTLCRFANDRAGEPFIHPVVRAILLHFGLGYDHPFVDGNGRTARALFYWAMAAQDYWLCESLSISRIIRRGPGKYVKAFLYSETDDGDVTYFILNQLGVVVRAIEELHSYLQGKVRELRDTRNLIQRSAHINAVLNHRQLALVNHAMKNPGFLYTIESHRNAHNVSYQTARTDLLSLAGRQLLGQGKSGKAFVFAAPAGLRARLERLADEPVGRLKG